MHLAHGKHNFREQGMCVMEAVVFLAGEKHTDYPSCVDQFITRVARVLNDQLDDDERQRLIAYIPLMMGTKGDGLERWRAPRFYAGSAFWYTRPEIKWALLDQLIAGPPLRLNPRLEVRELVPA